MKGRPKSNEAGLHPLLSSLGTKVRTLRAARQLTRRALADEAGLSERFVGELEAGRANISVVNLAEVAKALGVGLTALLDGGESDARSERSAPASKGVISLLGLRGAGKSTVGKKLAHQLGVGFFELDRLVEAEAGMLLSEIFAIHGEDYYRRLELAALKRFLQSHERAVLATGGGLVTSADAFKLLREKTRTVWLKAQPEEHWERVLVQGDLRPMQNRPHAMAELKRRLKEREPLYARAELTMSTTGKTVDHVVRALRAQVPAPA